MRVKMTYMKDGEVIAEAEFETADMNTLSHVTIDEVRRLRPDIGLFDEGVWIKYDTVRD